MFYLFIDEIQLMERWEKWIRTYYDKNKSIKFIISGSCSSLLDKEYATSITGRNITFQVKPLSFVEFVSFNFLDKILYNFMTSFILLNFSS